MTPRGHAYLFLVVDCFSKICVLIPCKKTLSRCEATKLFSAMFGYISNFQTPSYLIETISSLENFGQFFGRERIPSYGIPPHSILRLMGK